MDALSRPGRTIAGRTFAAFVVASLLPLAAGAWFAVPKIRAAFADEALAELERAGERSARVLLDRLLAAEAVLTYSAAVASPERPVQLDAAAVVTQDGVRALFGELVVPVRLDRGAAQPHLLVRRERGVSEVLIAKAVDGGLAVGRVDASYLWPLAELLPREARACVYADSSRVPLSCSPPRSGETAAGGETDAIARRELVSTERPLALDALGGGRWSVLVRQPRSAALGARSSMGAIVAQALALSLIPAVLLAVHASRRALKPLQELLAGARRIARRDFSEPLPGRRDDELGALGQTINAVGEDLDRQHETLAAFAEIDRLILSSRDTRRVLDDVLTRVSGVVPDCHIAVLLLGAARGEGRFYCGAVGERGDGRLVDAAVSNELRVWLAQQRTGALHDAHEVKSRLAEYPFDSRAGNVFVVPILHGDSLQGALFACFEPGVGVPESRRESLRDFASRCAVAVSIAAREQQLFHRAYFDALTGLPNRRLCHDRLRQAVAVARREEHKLAVVFIDLDGFKHVNDSLGHSCGDELLRETALRLRAVLRETDTVARLGGDEYVVILPHVHGALEAEVIAENIMEVLRSPFTIQGHTASISASIGVTIFPDDASSVEDLLRKADTAMYEAKDRGRERCVFFAEEMDDRVHERLALHTDLRGALANKELFLVYQPQIDLVAGRVVCAEALLRWRHPTRGLVPLASFLPVLEETGLVESIGGWVLQTALAEFAKWKRDGLGIERVAVNAATRQLFDAGLVDLVDESLRRAELSGSCLEIELTESSLVSDFNRTNRVLRSLAERDVRIAIDDFGTGYSSLGYLKDLTFDVVKIDRTFISNMHDARSMAIVNAVLGIAHSMGKKVVAEGIESDAQRRELTRLGCDIGQGFLLGRPMTGPAFAKWIWSREATQLLSEAFALRA